MIKYRIRRDDSKDAERAQRQRRDRGRAAYYQALEDGRDRAEAIAKASAVYYGADRPKPAPEPVAEVAKPADATVPDGWQNLHWKKRVVIAREIWPDRQFVSGADADEAITRYLEHGR